MNQEEVTKILNELSKVSEILGGELTDLANETAQNSINTQMHIMKTRKDLGELASILSSLVVRDEIQNPINKVEVENLEKLKAFTSNLGNMQYKLNEIGKKYDQIIEITNSLNDMGTTIGEEIMRLQDEARVIKTIFRDLGFEVPKTDIQKLLGTFEQKSTITV